MKFLAFLLASSFTISLAGAGVRQDWVRHLGLPGGPALLTSMAANDSGLVAVCGSAWNRATSDDLIVIAYDPDGSRRWLATYDGPSHDVDIPTAIAVDRQGNVLVTGLSISVNYFDYVTLKYSGNGTLLWVARYDAGGWYDESRAIALDDAGNVYVTGRSVLGVGERNHYATIKYDAQGNEKWVARYPGQGHENVANAIAVDRDGNVVVTGYSYAGNGDFATLQYDADGALQWASRYDGPAHGFDSAIDLGVDPAGNVFVTGFSSVDAADTSYDYATVKYDRHGIEQWVRRYDGDFHSIDKANAIAVDQRGHAYVTGYSTTSGGGADWITIHYGADGAEVWRARYGAPDYVFGMANDVQIDRRGHVFVAGHSVGKQVEFATLEYDRDGNRLCEMRYASDGAAIASDVAVDRAGRVYTAGQTEYGPNQQRRFTLIKYVPVHEIENGPRPGG